MNKKNYTLTAAILLALGSNSFMFTSCQKDYDGQLEIIRNQIKNGEVSVKGLEYKYKLVCEQIEILNEAIGKPETENKDGLKIINEGLAALKEEMRATIDSLQKAIDENNPQNGMSIKNDIEAATQKYNAKLQEFSNELNKIDPTLNILDGRTVKLEYQLKAMEEKQAAMQKTIVDLKAEIAGMGDDMAEQKKKLEEALAKLEELDSRYTQDIADVRTQLEAVKNATAENAANLEELRQQTINSIAEIREDIDKKVYEISNQMAGLSDAVSSLSDSFTDLDKKYDKMNDQLNKLQYDYNQQIQNIWEAINNISDGGDISELEKAVAELEKNLSELQTSMNEQLKDILATQAFHGNELQRIDEIVNKHTEALNSMSQKLDELGVLVGELQSTIKSMQKVFENTIAEIEKRLDNLEQTGNPGLLEQMQEDIKNLKKLVEVSFAEIEGIKGDQILQAEKLAEVQITLTNHIIAAQENYNQLTGRIDNLEGFVDVLASQMQDIDKSIADLYIKIAANSNDIVTLKKQIEDLENGLGDYVTYDDVMKILGEYDSEIQKDFTEIYSRLDNCASKDEVEKLVESMDGIKRQLETMSNDINSLNDKYRELEEKVNNLMNRIQSMELIADYNNGMVKAERLGNGKYALNLKVEITPENVIPEVADLPGMISLKFKDVMSTRGADSDIKNCVVGKIEKVGGLLSINATFEAPSPMGETLPYQVAVVFDDKNSNKLTEYRAMYVGSSLTLMSGSEKIAYRNGIDSFSSSETYIRNVLTEQKISGTMPASVVQINGSPVLFENGLKAYFDKEGSNKDGYKVLYSMKAVYDNNNKPQNHLTKRIGITPETGNIFMKEYLSPSDDKTNTLEGYKIIVGVQAVENGEPVDAEHYICFQLERE